MSDSHNVYTMKLHDYFRENDIAEILRVPGGWIYIFFEDCETETPLTSVFVPFNNEFQKND